MQKITGEMLLAYVNVLKCVIEDSSCEEASKWFKDFIVPYSCVDKASIVVISIVYATRSDLKLGTQWLLSYYETGKLSLKKTEDAERDIKTQEDGYLESPLQTVVNYASLVAELTKLRDEVIILTPSMRRSLLRVCDQKDPSEQSKYEPQLSGERGSNVWLVVKPPTYPVTNNISRKRTAPISREKYDALMEQIEIIRTELAYPSTAMQTGLKQTLLDLSEEAAHFMSGMDEPTPEIVTPLRPPRTKPRQNANIEARYQAILLKIEAVKNTRTMNEREQQHLLDKLSDEAAQLFSLLE